MNQFLYGVARAITETFSLPEPILEVGAYQVAGQEPVANLRRLFPGRHYVGVDMRAGPGVDCVADVEDLPQQDGSVGTVVSFNTFEHVRRFWRGFDEVRRVLRPDGVLIVSCPFHFHIHNYPHDYWRFTPAAFEFLLEDYPSKIIGWHGPRRRPAGIWAVAFRPERSPIAAEQYARYRQLLTRYAHEPARSWARGLRYRLASLLCGRGPFASYLDREVWDSQWLQSAGAEAHRHASSAAEHESAPKGRNRVAQGNALGSAEVIHGLSPERAP
jgi:SAM-dependent methyltransferase